MPAKLATSQTKVTKREADVVALIAAGNAQLPAVTARASRADVSHIPVDDQSSKATHIDVAAS